jgi:hypothetical protein
MFIKSDKGIAWDVWTDLWINTEPLVFKKGTNPLL